MDFRECALLVKESMRDIGLMPNKAVKGQASIMIPYSGPYSRLRFDDLVEDLVEAISNEVSCYTYPRKSKKSLNGLLGTSEEPLFVTTRAIFVEEKTRGRASNTFIVNIFAFTNPKDSVSGLVLIEKQPTMLSRMGR